MTRMIAIERFRYAGKIVNPGDEFEVGPARDIQILSIMKKAKEGQEEENSGETAVEDESGQPSLQDRPKRRYRRRDMRSES
jgi:hypothetical protein